MKRLIAILILTSATSLFVSCSQSAEPVAPPTPALTAQPVAESPEKAEAEITQLERDWVAAIVNKDPATLDRLLAEDFNGTSITGGTFPKRDAIEDIKEGTYVVESMDLDEVSVNVYGNAAVSFTSQKEKSKYAGKDSSGHYHFTNTWIKRDGKWQVVASHGSPYGK
jgi:ketosteroid isomerase-like protein